MDWRAAARCKCQVKSTGSVGFLELAELGGLLLINPPGQRNPEGTGWHTMD